MKLFKLRLQVSEAISSKPKGSAEILIVMCTKRHSEGHFLQHLLEQ